MGGARSWGPLSCWRTLGGRLRNLRAALGSIVEDWCLGVIQVALTALCAPGGWCVRFHRLSMARFTVATRTLC